MKNTFVTITGLDHYLGKKPFKVGRIVKLVKDTKNDYDCDAIAVKLPYIGRIGYVANSTCTVFQGTCSASRLYDKIGESALAEITIITHSSVIARVLTPEEENEARKNPFPDDTDTNDDDSYDDDDFHSVPPEIHDKKSII